MVWCCKYKVKQKVKQIAQMVIDNNLTCLPNGIDLTKREIKGVIKVSKLCIVKAG
ncbi:MAG: hypothetical protein K0R77_1664 [Chryseobacterium sp.]|jgi:hypothetical protein|nr:hypothetical protein [Chryseobacterium sp.]